MDFGKIFGPALRYPLNSKLFLILFLFSFCMILPVMIHMPTGVEQTLNVSELKAFFRLFVPLWIISFFVGNFLAAFFFDSASRYLPKMKYGKLKDSFESAKKRYFSLLATQILFFIIVCFVFCVTFLIFGGFSLLTIPFTSLTFGGVPAIVSLGILLGLFIGVVTSVAAVFLLFLSPVVCVVDKLGPIDSLRRSFNLIKINKANTFVFGIILLIIIFSIGFVGVLPSMIYSLTTGNVVRGFNAGMILFTIIQLIFGVYTGLFNYSAQVNYYHSLKKASPIKAVRKKVKKKDRKRKR